MRGKKDHFRLKSIIFGSCDHEVGTSWRRTNVLSECNRGKEGRVLTFEVDDREASLACITEVEFERVGSVNDGEVYPNDQQESAWE